MTRKDAIIQVNKAYVGITPEHFHWKLINQIYDEFETEHQEELGVACRMGAQAMGDIMKEKIEELTFNVMEHKRLEARIAELEAHNRELAKDFTHSKYVDLYADPKTCEMCKTHNYANSECDLLRYLPEWYRKDFGCIKYTPMEKK